jgi:dTDP-4-dehydrorhamnose reductase
MIFRTSWVYGATGKNFLLTILKLAREREKLRIVADQYGAPTWSRDLAKMAARAIDRTEASARGEELSEAMRPRNGVYHAAGAGETTWFGFAAEAVRLAGERDPETKLAELEGISTAEFPTAAKRPSNSRMNCDKLAAGFGWKMMDWKDSLREVMAEI